MFVAKWLRYKMDLIDLVSNFWEDSMIICAIIIPLPLKTRFLYLSLQMKVIKIKITKVREI